MVLTGQAPPARTFKHSEAAIQQGVHSKRRDRNSQGQEIREERRCANEQMQANGQKAQFAARTGKGPQDKLQGRSMWAASAHGLRQTLQVGREEERSNPMRSTSNDTIVATSVT